MAKTTLNNVRIQLRNDTAANWAKSTVVLLVGEFAVENDTGLFKIGNGTDVFSALPYANNAAEVAQEFNALKDKIGEIPDDKTIIEMIQSAAESGSYDDTALSGRVTKNEQDIASLNSKMDNIEAGSVTSVNGKTGEVTIVASDIITSSSDVNKISIASDGTLEVNGLTFDRIIQEESDELIISGGNA